MEIYYEVRFTLYHYNSGDGRNGNYRHEEKFLDLAAANAFKDKLTGWLYNKESTSEFAGDYCWDGYLVRVNGVYEITEKKL